MKNLTLLLLLLPALLLHSCKKSSNPPSIVGTWKIAGISGTQTSQSSPTATLINRTYIYTSPVLTVTDTVTTLVTVNNETWAFNSDGTFSIAENYTIGTSVIAVVHNLSGWWDYTSSTPAQQRPAAAQHRHSQPSTYRRHLLYKISDQHPTGTHRHRNQHLIYRLHAG